MSGSTTYIREGYLRHAETDILNECGIMNAVYRNECAPMRNDYAKTHKRPERPMNHIKNEMSTIEDADKGSATHRAAMENYAKLEQAKARQARGERPPARHPQQGRDNNRKPFNGGRGCGRECFCDDRELHVVLHVTVIVATAAMDAIRTVDVTTTADVITIVDTTRAADATAEGMASGTMPVTLAPWTKAVTGPDLLTRQGRSLVITL